MLHLCLWICACVCVQSRINLSLQHKIYRCILPKYLYSVGCIIDVAVLASTRNLEIDCCFVAVVRKCVRVFLECIVTDETRELSKRIVVNALCGICV